MMRKAIAGSLTVGIMLGVGSGYAQLLVDPSALAPAGQIQLGGALGFASKVKYDMDGGGQDIKRTTLYGSAAYGLNDQVDAYAGLGLIAKAEPDDWPDSGSGFIIGAGARASLFKQDKLGVNAYGELHYLSEDYGSMSESDMGITVSASAEGTLLEAVLGVVGTYALDEKISLYGALELIPFSDGEVKFDLDTELPSWAAYYYDVAELLGDLGLDKVDIERDGLVTIRLGGTYKLDPVVLRGELALGSETAITVGGGITF